MFTLFINNWNFVSGMATSVACFAKRYHKMNLVFPRLFKATAPIQKVVLSVMDLKAILFMTDNASVLIPFEHMKSLCFPSLIKK